jgi:hypothetical protein
MTERVEPPASPAHFTLEVEGVLVTGVVRVSALELTGAGIGVNVAPVTVTRVAGTDDLFSSGAHDTMGRGGERATRDLVLTLHDDHGPTVGWQLLGVMPVAYSPAGQLDALTPGLVTESLTVSVTEVRAVPRREGRPG